MAFISVLIKKYILTQMLVQKQWLARKIRVFLTNKQPYSIQPKPRPRRKGNFAIKTIWQIPPLVATLRANSVC